MFDIAAAQMSPPVRPRRTDTVRPLQQSSEFAGALRYLGRTPLILPQLDRILVLRRRFWPGIDVAMLPRVQLRKPQRLLEILQEEGLTRTPILLSPDHPEPNLGPLGAVPLVGPARAAILKLDRDLTQLRAQLHQKWRNRLVHSESQALRVTQQNLAQDPTHWVLTSDQIQQRQRRYQNWPIALTLAYARENPGQAKLFTAYDGNDPVAAILVLRHGGGATYHIAVSSPRGRQTSAHNLLIWNAIEWLHEQGCVQLDLGLVNTEDAPGLARFKLGTGADLQTLGGTWIWWPPLGRTLGPLAALDRRLMTFRHSPRKTGQQGHPQVI
ncbi:GNAT family N-acetyltransferase [Aliisedimentitalea scapharcae]|uniref:GNAT family N-acetyltransferase n=2 Tax=Aliisedimentitalea scapharcae TaxID=1524259 RepID=A0ABZ2XP33_9RHOB